MPSGEPECKIGTKASSEEGKIFPAWVSRDFLEEAAVGLQEQRAAVTPLVLPVPQPSSQRQACGAPSANHLSSGLLSGGPAAPAVLSLPRPTWV